MSVFERILLGYIKKHTHMKMRFSRFFHMIRDGGILLLILVFISGFSSESVLRIGVGVISGRLPKSRINAPIIFKIKNCF